LTEREIVITLKKEEKIMTFLDFLLKYWVLFLGGAAVMGFIIKYFFHLVYYCANMIREINKVKKIEIDLEIIKKDSSFIKGKVSTIEKLIKAGMPPALVVCNPDRPIGRKRIITPPPVKARIMNQESGIRDRIKIIQPEKLEIRNWELCFWLINASNFSFRYAIISPCRSAAG